MPTANRLKKLIEIFLQQHAFKKGQTALEVFPLWQAVKLAAENLAPKGVVFPDFDKALFENLGHQSPGPFPVAAEPVYQNYLPFPVNQLVGRNQEAAGLTRLLQFQRVRMPN